MTDMAPGVYSMFIGTGIGGAIFCLIASGYKPKHEAGIWSLALACVLVGEWVVFHY